MYAFSALATCSVADCERKHGQHKALAAGSPNTTFVSLLVNSVNDEARQNYLRSQRLAKESYRKQMLQQPLAEKRKLGGDVASCSTDARPVVARASKHSKMSPLHMYRKHVIAAGKSNNVSRNWVDVSSWDEIKQSFSKLSQAEKQHWQMAAIAFNARAMQKNKGAEVKSEVRLLKPTATELEPVTENDSKVCLPPILNTSLCFSDSDSIKISTGSVPELQHHLESRYRSAACTKSVDPWPLQPTSILSALLGMRCRGLFLKDAVKHLAKTCQVTVGPLEHDQFPEKVLYQQYCRGVCCNSIGWDFVHCNLVSKQHTIGVTIGFESSDLKDHHN